MKPFTITFIGNKEVAQREAVLKKLAKYLESYFDVPPHEADETQLIFYCGGYGEFSGIASKAIDILRERYPEVETKKIFVTPYITPSYQQMLNYIKDCYDEIIYPPLENVPPQYAIIRRNKWMIDNSDIMITYMRYTFGSTKKCVDYAKCHDTLVYDLYKESLIKHPKRKREP